MLTSSCVLNNLTNHRASAADRMRKAQWNCEDFVTYSLCFAVFKFRLPGFAQSDIGRLYSNSPRVTAAPQVELRVELD